MTESLLKRLLSCLLALLVAASPAPIGVAWAGEAAAPENVRLEAIDINDDQVLIHLSGKAEFTSFVTANPPRLVIELQDTDYQAAGRSFSGKGKVLRSVRSGQYQRTPRMISRLVLDLTEPTAYKISRAGNRLVVAIGAGGAAETQTAKAAPKPEPKAEAPAPAPTPAAAQVEAAPAATEAKAEPKPAAAAAVAKPAPKKARRKTAKAKTATAAKAPAGGSASGPAKTEAPLPGLVPAAAPATVMAGAAKKESSKQAAKPTGGAAAGPKSDIWDGDETPPAPASAPDAGEASAPALAQPPVQVAAAVALPSVGAPLKVSAPVGESGGMTSKPSAEVVAIATGADATKGGGEDSAEAPAKAAPSSAGPAGIRNDIMGRLPRHPISVDFENTDFRDILRFFSSAAKLNIIYGDDIGGNLSLHLEDVPFHEAFRTALTMMNYTTVQVGDNILRVLTPANVIKSQQTQAVVTKVIPLNYANAAQLVAAINQVRTAEGRQGIAIADSKNNALIVTESLEGLLNTERLIQQLDVRPKQVLIEVKLVEVNLNNALHYGIQWDMFQNEKARLFGKSGRNFIGTTVSPTPSAGASTIDLQSLDANTMNVQLGATGGVGATAKGTGVNLPATSVFGALTFGRISNNYFFNATMTAAAAQGKVKVLSDPKIATLNNQPANINVTTQIPYNTSNVAASGVTSNNVAFVTTGIQLTVTPTINADGRISLNINPNVSQPSAVQASAGVSAPAIDSRNAQTTVLVRDGETVVIGGLINDSVSNTVAKIPLLGDIPILGWLFKKKSITRTRAELLIFVTPKIMD